MAHKARDARIAQLVEQRIENPRVGGSNPPPGTIFYELNEDCSGLLAAVWPLSDDCAAAISAVLLVCRYFLHHPDCHVAGRSCVLASDAVVGAVHEMPPIGGKGFTTLY